MKKMIISLISIFLIVLIILISTIISAPPKSEPSSSPEAIYSSEDEIFSNSKWIKLKNTDFNSLLLRSYSPAINSVITSLEKAVPVIIKVSGGQFSKNNKTTYIVASCFSSPDSVTVYTKSDNSFTKNSASLEEILEDATEILISNDLEVAE